MERKAYLINYSFRYYMIAAIMTMAAMNLSSIINGILMGNLLGANAFSAINVAMPIVSCISAIGALLAQGPASRIAQYLGAMENERANQVFTVSIVSMLIVCLSLSVIMATTNLSGYIVGLLNVTEELTSLVNQYAGTLMAGCLLLIFQNGLSLLVDVMGKPKMVTIGMTAGMIANVIFAVIAVKVLGMDIVGAAYATLFGAFVCDTILLYYIFKQSGMKLRRSAMWLADFTTGISYSLPSLTGTASVVILMLLCNSYIMDNQGADGMFVMSIGYTIISVGSMISNGVGMSYTAIGGMMLGQGDYRGMRLLFSRGLFVVLLAPVCFNLAGLFSNNLATLFGANTPELIELTGRGLPMICVLLFALGIISSVTFLHVVLGHRVISTINSLMILFSVAFSLYILDWTMPPEQIWLAFPLATVLSLLFLFANTTSLTMRSKGKLQLLSLIPKDDPERKMLDISVECNMNAEVAAINTLVKFLQENGASDWEKNVVHCLDELMMNIVQHSGRGDGSYMDLSVMLQGDKISAYLRNEGKPFDPLQVKKADRKIGMTLLFHYCSRLEYRYSFSQNIVLVSWEKATVKGVK